MVLGQKTNSMLVRKLESNGFYKDHMTFTQFKVTLPRIATSISLLCHSGNQNEKTKQDKIVHTLV